jgi:hypothetical protein
MDSQRQRFCFVHFTPKSYAAVVILGNKETAAERKRLIAEHKAYSLRQEQTFLEWNEHLEREKRLSTRRCGNPLDDSLTDMMWSDYQGDT